MTRTKINARSGAALDAARPYARRIRDDRKLRKHALNALQSGDSAAARLRGGGAIEAVKRVAADEAARRELRRAAEELARARARLEKSRSHRRRNAVVFVGGLAALLLNPKTGPKTREWIRNTVPTSDGASATTVDESIRVEVPVTTTYNQWTQFEEFPQFMQGVEWVEQLDETRLRWVARVAGKRQEWEAKITEQEPDHRISWAALAGKGNSGTVIFRPLDANATEVSVSISYPPTGIVENLATRLGLDRRRVRGDLVRFKKLIESRGTESGAWRGRIEAGETTDTG